MAPIRHSDTDLGWVNRRFAELQKQINALRSEKRLQSSSISEGGITVRDGGSIHVQDGGDILVWYPQDSYSGAAIVAGDVYSSDTGDYSGTGLLVQKTTSGGGNGDDVLTAIANPGTGDAQVIIRSDGDAAVWADNDGLQRPYLATPPLSRAVHRLARHLLGHLRDAVARGCHKGQPPLARRNPSHHR